MLTLGKIPLVFSAPDFVRFVIFTLLTAPPNYLWQYLLERLFPSRKPLDPTKPTLPRYEACDHDPLLDEGHLQQDEESEAKLDWKNTIIKWLLDCMTLGALLNVSAFIILMGFLKGRSLTQIGSALRTVCTPISILCYASTARWISSSLAGH
jgi:hypothetical protein